MSVASSAEAPPTATVPRVAQVSRVLTVGIAVALVVAMLGASVVLQLVGVGPNPHQVLSNLWFYTDTPLSPARIGDNSCRLLIRLMLVLLVTAWLALGLLVARRRVGVRLLAVAAVLTALPMLIGPPLFSDDVYAYAAGGAMIHHGFDPYVQGPAVLGHLPVARSVNGFWATSPTPYGGLFLDLAWLVDVVTGERLFAAVAVFRGIEVVALLGAVALMLDACRPDRRSLALWAVGLNPLVLFSLVSAAHNDGLLLLALAGAWSLDRRGHRLGALLVLALGAQIKVVALVPAVILVAGYTLGTTLDRRPLRERLRLLVAHGGVLTGAFLLLGLASGRGFGWIHDLSVPNKALQLFTPAGALNDLAARSAGVSRHLVSYASAIGQPDPLAAIRVTLQGLSGILILLALVSVRRLGAARAGGLALLALALLGPVLWPWYLTWSVILLAIGGSGTDLVVLAVLSGLLCLPVLPGATPVFGEVTGGFSFPLADLVTLGAVALSGGALVVSALRTPPPRDGTGRHVPLGPPQRRLATA